MIKHRNPSFDLAKQILKALRNSTVIKKKQKTIPYLECLLRWLEQQQRDLNQASFSQFKDDGNFWKKQVHTHLELLRCLARLDPAIPIVPPDPKLAAATVPPKDDDEESAGVMANMVMEFVKATSPGGSPIPTSTILLEILAKGADVDNFGLLLQRAIDAKDLRMLKWLLDRRAEIDYITNLQIPAERWQVAADLCTADSKPTLEIN